MEQGREDECISSWYRWRHSLWLHCAIEAGFLLRQLVICNQTCQYWFLFVTDAFLKCGGQAIIQVGLLWIPHSIEAGLWAICAVWQCFPFQMVLLEKVLLCEALSDPTVSIGRFHSMYRIATFFCSLHVRLLHYKMRIYNMFCCGKLCALVLWLCDFIFYCFKRWWYKNSKAAY